MSKALIVLIVLIAVAIGINANDIKRYLEMRRM